MKNTQLYSSIVASLALPVMAQSTAAPNIIVFLVDDMGVMDTSVPLLTDEAGKPQINPLNEWYRTPSMERLAKQGTCISKYYAQSVSSPTRVSIMTGQNSTRHRTTNWISPGSNNRGTFGPEAWNWTGLTKDVMTLPKVLQSAGYRTIQIGKAHFGCKGSVGENPCNLGFEIKVAGCAIGSPGSYSAKNGYGAIKGRASHAVPDLDSYHGTETHLSDALTIEANKLITEAAQDKQPFFLYMSHYAVHGPHETDPRFIDHYPTSKAKSKKACGFATLIEGMDKSLGDMMDHLEALNIADNTIILFVGDNGSDAALGSATGYSSSAPLRGKKGTCYEGGARVPFIAAWAKPNPAQANQKKFPVQQGAMFSEQRATVMDIYPTVLELAQAKKPAQHSIDGSSLLSVLKGEKAPLPQRSILLHYPHSHHSSYFTSYIQDDWKLIYHYSPEKPNKASCELYNLAQDPYESKDLAASETKKLSELMDAMTAQLKSEDALPPVNKDKEALYPQIPKS